MLAVADSNQVYVHGAACHGRKGRRFPSVGWEDMACVFHIVAMCGNQKWLGQVVTALSCRHTLGIKEDRVRHACRGSAQLIRVTCQSKLTMRFSVLKFCLLLSFVFLSSFLILLFLSLSCSCCCFACWPRAVFLFLCYLPRFRHPHHALVLYIRFRFFFP